MSSRRARQVLRSRPAKVLLSLLLAAAILWLLLSRVDVDSVRAQIAAMTWIELVSIAAVAAWNFVTYWVLWVTVTPGLTLGQGMVISESGTAATNAIPGGSAIGVGLAYSMLDSWGFSRSRSTLAVLISGVWNGFIKLGLPVLALGLVALQGGADGSRILIGLTAIALLAAAVAVFAQMLRSDEAAARVGVLAGRAASWALRLVRRPPVVGWEIATVKFRGRTKELLARRWLAITAASLVSHLSLYLVLLVTLRHVGVSDQDVSWAEVLFVFAFARLTTAIRLTPGGIGVVEAVLIGGLVAAGGDHAQVTAAVLVFRALTWLLPIPLGALTYLGWRLRHGQRPVPVEPPSRSA